MNSRDHPLYLTWSNMKQRCFNANSPKYKYYGQRGITVCDEWINDFSMFLYHMGPRPEGYSLDRVDNDYIYCPENCRWSDITTQNNNKRKKNTAFNTYSESIGPDEHQSASWIRYNYLTSTNHD